MNYDQSGLRALADVQAEGLRAAGLLLERMLAVEPPAPGAPEPAADYSAVLDAWLDLARRTAAGLSAPGHPLTVPIDAVDIGPAVRLLAGESVEVWLHNGTTTPAGPFELRCGPLTRVDGTVLDATIRFDPARVESLPGRSSRAVSVALDGAPAAGVYRGVLQADGAPDLWLPLQVTVT